MNGTVGGIAQRRQRARATDAAANDVILAHEGFRGERRPPFRERMHERAPEIDVRDPRQRGRQVRRRAFVAHAITREGGLRQQFVVPVVGRQ